MKMIIYFEKEKGKVNPYLFVKDYSKGGLLRKERISYSFVPAEALAYAESSNVEDVLSRIRKDYPNAVIHTEEYEDFLNKSRTRTYWVINRWANVGEREYYDGIDKDNKPTYSSDIADARIHLSRSSAKETLRTIQQTTRDRVWVSPLYMNLINELLTPMFMILCTSKSENGSTKYFSRLEGNRVRLVKTSEGACKFNYEDAISMYDYLITHNKHFWYHVMPKFNDNVNYKAVEKYIAEKKISRMIALDLQLKHINRNGNESGKD